MDRTRRRLLGLLSLPLALSLAGCGVKGRIEEPEGQESVYVYPRTYPDPKTVVPSSGVQAPAPPVIPGDTFGNERKSTTVIRSQ